MPPEAALTERALSVRVEGLMLYRSWAEQIIRAQYRDEPVPTPGDVDEMADWLDERGLIEEPVDKEQARVLIELVQAGGERTFREAAE